MENSYVVRCWIRYAYHSFSRLTVQTFFSPFKSMTDNAIFKLCEQKSIFLSSNYLRITLFFFYKQLDFWLSPQKLFSCLVKNAPKSCLAVVYIKIS